jgi:hypothetical protein
VGDIHRSSEHWPERLFVAQLDRLREDERVAGCLYQKYCDAYLGKKSFAEADRSPVAKEHDRLTGWLDGMAWSELRSPVDLHAMGLKVNYLGLSRDELYDLFSVLLLIEKLKAHLKRKAVSQNEIVEQLTPIFWGDKEEAEDFLLRIQGMKPKQITDLVKLLVSKKKIIEERMRRELWKVLNDNGLYGPSESNWNQQLK